MAPTASTSALQQQLHLASARRATFNKTRKGANKALNWPYPLTAAAARTSTIHPDRLVQAGFYCTPTHDDPTVTTCFLCEIVIGQWEEGEDPLYRHEAAIDEAEIRCGWLDVLDQSWTKEGADGLALTPKEAWPEIWGDHMHPRGERMAWARLATFRLGWPHEGQVGVPTKEEVRESPSHHTDSLLTSPRCARTDRCRRVGVSARRRGRIARPVRLHLLRSNGRGLGRGRRSSVRSPTHSL